MKHIYAFLLPLIVLFFCNDLKSQENNAKLLDHLFSGTGELYFKFTIHDKEILHDLTRIISIDNVKGLEVSAYANRKEFSEFLNFKIPYAILPSPGKLLKESDLISEQVMKDGIPLTSWNFYPSYQQYLDSLVSFATRYPEICKIDTIGTSVQGRLILAVKISDNVDLEEGEPEFLYTSSIHGDETTGYVLMLHLIDYLLSNYSSDPRIANIVNTTEIYINPLANPDGTYRGGNNSVYGAQRGNANNIDLNRNYWDPKVGKHPDGNPWQVETIAFMDYAERRHFVIGANFHGGAEVFNYPWDTWVKLTADDDWWQYVGREWADTVHAYGPSGYFTDLDNGITNGYYWYEVNGGRQDYMNYFHQSREVTLEISDIKLLPASQLINFWNYNYHSFLNYLEQANFGVQGIISDTVTGEPLSAKVFIQLHDKDSSHVYSKLPSGFYSRLLHEGNYNLTFSSPGYFTKTIKGVSITNRTTNHLDVQLKPVTFGMHEQAVNTSLLFPNPAKDQVRFKCPDSHAGQCFFEILTIEGKKVISNSFYIHSGNISESIDVSGLCAGLYLVRITLGTKIYTEKLQIVK